MKQLRSLLEIAAKNRSFSARTKSFIDLPALDSLQMVEDHHQHGVLWKIIISVVLFFSLVIEMTNNNSYRLFLMVNHQQPFDFTEFSHFFQLLYSYVFVLHLVMCHLEAICDKAEIHFVSLKTDTKFGYEIYYCVSSLQQSRLFMLN